MAMAQAKYQRIVFFAAVDNLPDLLENLKFSDVRFVVSLVLVIIMIDGSVKHNRKFGHRGQLNSHVIERRSYLFVGKLLCKGRGPHLIRSAIVILP